MKDYNTEFNRWLDRHGSVRAILIIVLMALALLFGSWADFTKILFFMPSIIFISSRIVYFIKEGVL